MTVAELITFLQCHKPDLRVFVEVEDEDGEMSAPLRAASIDEDEHGEFVYLMAYEGPSERVIHIPDVN